jgi:hypothetical protein
MDGCSAPPPYNSNSNYATPSGGTDGLVAPPASSFATAGNPSAGLARNLFIARWMNVAGKIVVHDGFLPSPIHTTHAHI